MDRRGFLAGVAGSAGVFAGCLGDARDQSAMPDDNHEVNPIDLAYEDDRKVITADSDEYERCENRIVRVSDLPGPAKEEARAAIEDGEYETEAELLLPAVIRPEEAYLKHDQVHHAVEITEDDDTLRLRLPEALPVFREPVTLENFRDDAVRVGLTIEHEETDRTLLNLSLGLEAGETVVLSDHVDFPYGTFHATVEGDDLDEDGEWEITWVLDQRIESGFAYPLELDDHGIFADPVDRDSSYGPCTWDEDGEVSTGH